MCFNIKIYRNIYRSFSTRLESLGDFSDDKSKTPLLEKNAKPQNNKQNAKEFITLNDFFDVASDIYHQRFNRVKIWNFGKKLLKTISNRSTKESKNFCPKARNLFTSFHKFHYYTVESLQIRLMLL